MGSRSPTATFRVLICPPPALPIPRASISSLSVTPPPSLDIDASALSPAPFCQLRCFHCRYHIPTPSQEAVVRTPCTLNPTRYTVLTGGDLVEKNGEAKDVSLSQYRQTDRQAVLRCGRSCSVCTFARAGLIVFIFAIIIPPPPSPHTIIIVDWLSGLIESFFAERLAVPPRRLHVAPG